MKILDNIVKNFKTKRYGFYVSIFFALIMLVYAILYKKVDESIYNVAVVYTSVICVVAFVILATFKESSKYAPIPLLVGSFLSLLFLVQAGGFIDYFTTQFFDGFSLSKLISLGFPTWFTFVGIILSFIGGCVCIYLPQNKVEKEEK